MGRPGNPLQRNRKPEHRNFWGVCGVIVLIAFLSVYRVAAAEVYGAKESGQGADSVEILPQEKLHEVDTIPQEWIEEILEDREILESLDMLDKLELYEEPDLFSPHNF